MSKPVGGRGKVAPYQTTHIRVPVPIKDEVEKLIEDYRLSVIDGIDKDYSILDLDNAKILSKKLLRSKVAKVEVIAKLLTAIYKVEVDKSELV